MEEKVNAKQAYERYLSRTHGLGRVFTVIVLVLLIAAPFVIGAYLSAMPNVSACLKAFLGVGLVYLVSGIVEYLIYVPMLGAGGSYLAFITGNLINMKIPCAINARDIVGVKSGTPENEIISTLSIATSSLVTIVVLAACAVSAIREKDEVTLFQRNISRQAIHKAVAVTSMSFAILLVSTLLLSAVTSADAMDIFYETVSATATVGLTRDLTP